MRKSLYLLMIVMTVIAFAFVSCDASTAPESDRLGSIILADSQSRSINVTSESISDVESLYWYYKAGKTDGGLFNTGATNGFVPVKEGEGESAKGLSGVDLGQFSYGKWSFSFCGVKEKLTDDDYVDTTKNEIKNPVIVYYGSQELTVDKDRNFLNLTLNAGDGLSTEIVFGEIYFEHENIIPTHSFSIAVKDSINGQVSTIDTSNAQVLATNGKVSITGLVYSATDAIADGTHVMKFTLTQNNVESNIATIATYELSYTVKKGYKYTIQGNLTSAEVKGNVNIGSYVVDVPETIASLVLPVTVDSTDSSKSVKNETTVSTLDLSVKYPAGVVLTNDTNTAVNGDNITADAIIGFEMKADKTGGIIFDTSTQEQTSYELTLNVSKENNNTLVEVTKFIGKNLEIQAVYHKVNENTIKQLYLTESPRYSEGDEYYGYDPERGILTLHVYHASPIDVITKKVLAVASIGDEKYTSLEAALDSIKDNNSTAITIEILRDIYFDQSFMLSKNKTNLKNIIINGNDHKFIASNTYDNSEDLPMVNTTKCEDIVFNNVIFDGNNKTFSLIGPGKDKTFNNCKFINSTNCHYYGVSTGNLVFKNCYFDCKMYNVNQSEGGCNVVFEDCILSGWNSFGTSEKVSFLRTTFTKTDNNWYSIVRTYSDTTFTDCSFTKSFVEHKDSKYGSGVNPIYQSVAELNNCKVIDSIDNTETSSKYSIYDACKPFIEEPDQNDMGVCVINGEKSGSKYISGILVGDNSLFGNIIADGYAAKINESNKYYELVAAIAKVNDNYYPTLIEAFNAAVENDNSTVDLLKDVDLESNNWTPFVVPASVSLTINGNGHTIKNVEID